MTPCPACITRPGCGIKVLTGTRMWLACAACRGSGWIGPRVVPLVRLCPKWDDSAVKRRWA